MYAIFWPYVLRTTYHQCLPVHLSIWPANANWTKSYTICLVSCLYLRMWVHNMVMKSPGSSMCALNKTMSSPISLASFVANPSQITCSNEVTTHKVCAAIRNVSHTHIQPPWTPLSLWTH